MNAYTSFLAGAFPDLTPRETLAAVATIVKLRPYTKSQRAMIAARLLQVQKEQESINHSLTAWMEGAR